MFIYHTSYLICSARVNQFLYVGYSNSFAIYQGNIWSPKTLCIYFNDDIWISQWSELSFKVNDSKASNLFYHQEIVISNPSSYFTVSIHSLGLFSIRAAESLLTIPINISRKMLIDEDIALCPAVVTITAI